MTATPPGVATLQVNLTGVCKMKVVYNSLLSGWFIVRGAHQIPISGRFETREAALAHLRRRNPFHTGI